MQKQTKITWKYETVTVIAPNGIRLLGSIVYWAKDYSIYMTHPFESFGCSGHLQYAVPAIYSTIETPRQSVISINLIERAKLSLLSLYAKQTK